MGMLLVDRQFESLWPPCDVRGLIGILIDICYRDGQKVRIHFLQASKKQFPEGLAEDVEIISLLLCIKCMRTF